MCVCVCLCVCVCVHSCGADKVVCIWDMTRLVVTKTLPVFEVSHIYFVNTLFHSHTYLYLSGLWSSAVVSGLLHLLIS